VIAVTPLADGRTVNGRQIGAPSDMNWGRKPSIGESRQ
jgi:hypothetical protein